MVYVVSISPGQPTEKGDFARQSKVPNTNVLPDSGKGNANATNIGEVGLFLLI